ncbi:hypothetical protein NLU13_3496 [Sarocladium strictum]|uniref:Zn(2)-C6 fungal-type domain-containing protein n=1 Tax=Sarocladium strictum TaxID=5046 RepID=A0AA39GNJ7_SARSR|nr:hypothetical protein NLU13_3496 [Sarocladium strictum]
MAAQKRACDACYKRKIQCDWEAKHPRCDWCEHQDLSCTFDRVRGRRKGRKARVVETAAARDSHPSQSSLGKRTEEEPAQVPFLVTGQPNPHKLFLQAHDSRSPSSTHSPSSRDHVSYAHINYDGCHFGHLSHQNGMPILTEEGRRWISSRAGEDVSFRKLQPQPRRYMKHQFLADDLCKGSPSIYALPEKSLTVKIFDVFIHSAFSMVFPLVDKDLFRETLALAYESQFEPLSIECVSAKACVLAFVSSARLFSERDTPLPNLDSERCAAQARHLLSCTADEATLTSLQACVMLTLYETSTGRLQSGTTFHAVACRMVFGLGGHTRLPPKHITTRSDRERRHIRILFWLCYIIDKDTALRTGQPPLMSGEYCDLTLPDGYDECYTTYLPRLHDKVPLSDDEAFTPHLPEDPRLSHLKEKVSRRLYSAQAVKKTNAELLRDIRELDEELEAWRLSIPAIFRPALSISNKSRVDVGDCLPRSMTHIIMHLGYHHVMTAIHRASSRCISGADAAADAEEWLPGVKSSMALALEASRSTLVYLRAAIRGVAGEAFWMIIFYPTHAMMALFCHILMDPLNPDVEQDVALLASTAELINILPIQRLTSHELAHIELVTEFVAELCYLSRKAIAKATAEYEHRQAL